MQCQYASETVLEDTDLFWMNRTRRCGMLYGALMSSNLSQKMQLHSNIALDLTLEKFS